MIEARELSKKFGEKSVIHALTFDVKKGEIFGLLGHNGAGKTTTIRLLTGQIHPTSGQSSIGGFDSATEQDSIKPLIGVVSDTQNLYDRMSAFENLALFASLYDIPRKRVQEMLEFVNLQMRSKDKVQTFSNGMKQRLLIARALLHQPEVLFLDEPSRGLDPTSSREIRTALKNLANTGITVFLTTHNMEEADELCDRVAFIKHGKIVVIDTPQNLKLRYGRPTVKVTFVNQQTVVLPLSDRIFLSQMLAQFDNQKVQTIHSEEASLEDVFIQLVGKDSDQ